MIVDFKKLTLTAIVPEYQDSGASGMDLRADIDFPITIEPGGRRLVMTGIAVEIPPGYEGQVRPRSGLALKHGITVANSPGTIDFSYRGGIGATLINHSNQPFTILPKDRIAQLVIVPVVRVTLREVSELTPTDRGDGAFGSTGVK